MNQHIPVWHTIQRAHRCHSRRLSVGDDIVDKFSRPATAIEYQVLSVVFNMLCFRMNDDISARWWNE